MTTWWPWLLSGVGVTGMVLLGKRRRVGWLFGIASEVLWLGYAILTAQWGFLVGVAAYGWAFYKGWKNWSPESS